MAIVTEFNTTSDIGPALSYGSQSYKAGYTLSANCSSKLGGAIRDFRMPFEVNNRSGDKVKVHRFVLSFANGNDSRCEVNRDDSKRYVEDFIAKLNSKLGHHFPIYAVENINTSQEHWHVYVGACSANGRKFHPKQSPLYMCRHINDSIAKSYHLNPIQNYRRSSTEQFTIENRMRFAMKHGGREPYSYYSDARQRISRAIIVSHDLDTFYHAMELQGCGVHKNFFRRDTKTFSVKIPYHHKNIYKDDADDPQIRKVRSRTLGNDFEKSSIKKAILNDSLKREYKVYAQPRKDVQGGQTDLPAILPSSMSKESVALGKMKNVKYKSHSRCLFDKLGKYHEHIKSSFHLSDIMKPNLESVDPELRRDLVEIYKTYEQICKTVDDIFKSAGSIFHSFSKNISKATERVSNQYQRPALRMSYGTTSRTTSSDNNLNNKYKSSPKSTSDSTPDPFGFATKADMRKALDEQDRYDKDKVRKYNQEHGHGFTTEPGVDPLAGVTNEDLDKGKTKAEKQAAARKHKNENMKKSSSRNEVKNHNYHKKQKKHKKIYHSFKTM